MDYLWDFLKLDLFVAQPQTFTFFLFTFSFLDPQPPKLIRRIALFAFIHSVYTDLLILVLPLHLHLANSLITAFILLFIIFRDLSAKQKIMMLTFTLLFSLIMELVVLLLLTKVAGLASHDDLIRNNIPTVIQYLYPQLIVLHVCAWFIRNRKLRHIKRTFAFVTNDERSVLLQIVLLIVGLLFILFSINLINIFSDTYNRNVEITLFYVVVALACLILARVIGLLVLTREQAIKTTQDIYVDDINRMFATIRGQRHDFINHLQVIHSMTQMSKTNELRHYVDELVRDTQEVSEIVNHGSPALAAFFQAKTAIAVTRGIGFSFEIPDKPLAVSSSIRVIDMIKILGNLVDNAFDEVVSLPVGSRVVHASVQYEKEEIIFKVSNQGKVLSKKEQSEMFIPGYTTKNHKEHSGLGLAIVHDRVSHYGGKLDLHSDSTKGTIFTVTIPLK